MHIAHVTRTFLIETRKFEKLSTAIVHCRSEPDAKMIHQLRICTKRIRANLWVLKHDYISDTPIKQLRRTLKKIGHTLGARRDCDVALNLANKQKIDAKNLNRARHFAGQKCIEILTRHSPLTITRLNKIYYELSRNPPKAAQRRSIGSLRKELLKWQFHTPKDNAEFHELRKTVKKSTYILEASKKTPHKRVIQFQRRLGILHDMSVFAEIAQISPEMEKRIRQMKKRVLKLRKRSLLVLIKHMSDRRR